MTTKFCGKKEVGKAELSVMLRQFWFREAKTVVDTHSDLIWLIFEELGKKESFHSSGEE